MIIKICVWTPNWQNCFPTQEHSITNYQRTTSGLVTTTNADVNYMINTINLYGRHISMYRNELRWVGWGIGYLSFVVTWRNFSNIHDRIQPDKLINLQMEHNLNTDYNILHSILSHIIESTKSCGIPKKKNRF